MPMAAGVAPRRAGPPTTMPGRRPRRGDHGVVDDDDLAAERIAADAAQQPAVVVDFGHDARTVRAQRDGDDGVAAALDIDLAGIEGEAGRFVVTDDVAAALADDDAIGLADDRAVAFLHLLALGAQLLEVVGHRRSDRPGGSPAAIARRWPRAARGPGRPEPVPGGRVRRRGPGADAAAGGADERRRRAQQRRAGSAGTSRYAGLRPAGGGVGAAPGRGASWLGGGLCRRRGGC